jgi:hypothetical protein
MAVNDTAMSTLSTSITPSDAPPCAVLVLDSMGVVVAANGTARELWRAAERTLVSEPFSHLVSADNTPFDADHADTAWRGRSVAPGHLSRRFRRCRRGAPIQRAAAQREAFSAAYHSSGRAP